MNKKLIIGILIFLILLIIGFVIIVDMNKADAEVPSINTHLQTANTEYNNAVTYLNSKNYSQATEHINTSYTEYVQAQTRAQNALKKATRNNQSIQIQYFNLTLTEIEYKINATLDLYNGLTTVNNSPSQATQYFTNSHKNMVNATEYSDKRKLLEEQYPDKFTK
ncbi:MAG: hypothetical protein IJI98_01735 [Methanosphaera sp.]|uniref:hypothetical protein n=1 Tax=Methanosphaera sp. ISO3-F5 TaxID=1452353 RepID=UPI002B25A996|nr:hypothetical protein [Methanosphaera sp. ISO3-F5]MBR0471404.1 hypothetical protein [Methanosphaera sp.]WQH63454.1 hypothetical protein PXD04_07015 [Methanosphaera sp. ISO3-F5]